MTKKQVSLWGTFFHVKEEETVSFPCFFILILVYLNSVLGGMTKWKW